MKPLLFILLTFSFCLNLKANPGIKSSQDSLAEKQFYESIQKEADSIFKAFEEKNKDTWPVGEKSVGVLVFPSPLLIFSGLALVLLLGGYFIYRKHKKNKLKQ